MMQFPDEVMTHCNVPSWVERSWKISLIGTPRAKAILRRVWGRGSRWRFSMRERYEAANPVRSLNSCWVNPFWFRS